MNKVFISAQELLEDSSLLLGGSLLFGFSLLLFGASSVIFSRIRLSPFSASSARSLASQTIALILASAFE